MLLNVNYLLHLPWRNWCFFSNSNQWHLLLQWSLLYQWGYLLRALSVHIARISSIQRRTKLANLRKHTHGNLLRWSFIILTQYKSIHTNSLNLWDCLTTARHCQAIDNANKEKRLDWCKRHEWEGSFYRRYFMDETILFIICERFAGTYVLVLLAEPSNFFRRFHRYPTKFPRLLCDGFNRRLTGIHTLECVYL